MTEFLKPQRRCAVYGETFGLSKKPESFEIVAKHFVLQATIIAGARKARLKRALGNL
jgi:hypothetical protein